MDAPARQAGLDLVRLATPTSDAHRLPKIVEGASGFLYYVAIAGMTGTHSAEAAAVYEAIARLRRFTNLPIVVGFGIKTPQQAADIARVADAAVVASALVDRLARNLDPAGKPLPSLVDAVFGDIAALADGVRGARRKGQ
jgi:tryptophan synthase alpha chain